MSPLVIATALSILSLDPGSAASPTAAASTHGVAPVTVKRHRPVQFDDTDIDIIGNGGDPHQVLCADRPIVGSRFIRHICYTREQWGQIKFQQAYHTNRMMRRLGEDGGLNGGLGDASRPPGADNPQ